MRPLYFLEVEAEDRPKVTEHFPDANIIEETLSEDAIIEKCKDAEVLCVSLYSQITKTVIENLPDLKLVITRTVGYNQIDLKAAKENDVLVANVPDYGSHVIAEHVFAILLSSIRNVIPAEHRTEHLEFDFHGLRGMALKGKTLGVIGTGRIGTHVARIASLGFLMNVLAYDINEDQDAAAENHFTYTDLNTLFQKSDIITLHCPLLPSTRHLIDAEKIAKMKDKVVIVNTARGEIIKTPDLVSAIKSGKISHAALDVLEHEKNIAENKEIMTMDNVIITPHIAFYADDSVDNMYAVAIQDIKNFLETGKVKHQVVGE